MAHLGVRRIWKKWLVVGSLGALLDLHPALGHAGVTGNGASSTFSNGASRDLSNGASIKYGNGASTTFSNGASVNYPNGAAVSFSNGASVSLSNGASVSLSNGASVNFPNGASVSFPNGASAAVVNGASTHFANGASISLSNGASITLTNGATMNFPNGALISYPNGAMVTFPNGASTTFPNGARVSYPNGASVSYPNGGTVLVGGYSTQAFLSSHLWSFIDSGQLIPSTWNGGSMYSYLVAALQKQNGHPYTVVADRYGQSYEPDPYDLISFKYLIRSAANATTSFTLSYVYGGQTYSEIFPGGLGLCQAGYGGGGDWIATVAPKNPPNAPLNGCAQWLTAAIGLFTQPSGINNSISIRNLAVGDTPAITAATSIDGNAAPALALMNLIQPLPKKRGVAFDPTASSDNRNLESMIMSTTGSSGAYAATTNTQGGWAGGYAFRCTGGDPVVFNFNNLKTANAVIPGTSVLQKNANLVVRICKGVHGCNKNDADWVTDNDDYSGSDVWPQSSFICGTGFSEVASANYTNYNFVYNWLVRSKDGTDAIANGIASLCDVSPESVCRSTTANPTVATANTAPSTEALIYSRHEALFYGRAIGPTAQQAFTPGSPFLLYDPVNGGVTPDLGALASTCDVRSVENTPLSSAHPLAWTPNTALYPSLVNALWTGSYPSFAQTAVPTDRNTYKREYCLSQRTDVCIPCVQNAAAPSHGAAGWLPAPLISGFLNNGTAAALNFPTEPWLSVARDPGWIDPPQYSDEAVPVENGYYNATRVCSQQFDRTGQGYCFTDWQENASSSCGTLKTVNGVSRYTCASTRYTDSTGAALASSNILSVWLPQPIQPISSSNAGLCPTGYSKGKQTGYTSRCFRPQASGAACSVADECSSAVCNASKCN